MEHKLTRPSRSNAPVQAQRRRAVALAYDNRMAQAAVLAQHLKRADRPVLRMEWTLDAATGRPVCAWRVADAHTVAPRRAVREPAPLDPSLRRAA